MARASLNFTGPLSAIGNRLFGTKKKEEEEKPKLPPPKPKAVALPVLLWLGARLPFAAFVTIVGMFTYMYHILPILPWLLVFVSIDFALLVCWPPRQIGEKRRGFWDWSPMVSWALAIGCAVGCGLINYGIIESWINTAFLREYSNVQPTTLAAKVLDAGVLSFTADTQLAVQSAAGYKFWFYNYCAAPIVGPDPTAAPITFWAVGVGCCGKRGEFVCDSAEDLSAQSGMPLRPHNLGPEITSHYNNAIRMSAAANDLEVAKETVFVVWHKDPKAVGKFAWWLATGLFLLFTMVALCACCACQSGYMHTTLMQKT